MTLTNLETQALRQNCHSVLPGHFQSAPAEEFAAMAAWSAEKQVAHDVYGDGSLVQEFEAQIATLIGMEAAVFCITGTMAQATALRLACEGRGNRRVALHPTSHILKHERSNFQLLDHFHALQIGDPYRPWTVNDLKALAEPIAAAQYELPMREIGGQLPTWDALAEIKSYCSEQNIHLHMDGARLWEAASGFGKSPKEIAAGFDSVYVSFYKGIGGLGGAMLLGNASFVAQAKVWMQRQGGNVYRRSPYVVSAAMQFEKRMAEMPAYFQRTLWLYELLKAYPQLVPNPTAPLSNMLHVYVPVSSDRATNIRNHIAKEYGIWLFGRAVNTALPRQCMFEWYVGDQLLQMPDDDVRKALDLLAQQIAASEDEAIPEQHR
jgi:threonine aldolase